MYHTVEEFLKDRKEEEQNSLKIFAAITEDVKSLKIHENVRSLERLAWHITQTLSEMGKNCGLFENDLLDHLPIPSTLQEITETYINYNTLLVRAVSLKWNDEQLEETVNMYGESWTKGTVLKVINKHESHHRSQMTVIMRMAGLLVPGLYGPSKEEWQSMGIPPME